MDIEKLIEQLNDWNEKYISNLCGDRTIKCEEYCIKDDCLIVKAATALSTLQAENEKLRDEMKQERAHRLHAEQHADAFLEDCKRLNAELEQVKWENNALWTYIEIVDREYRRYMDRGYIDRLDELKRTWKCGRKED